MLQGRSHPVGPGLHFSFPPTWLFTVVMTCKFCKTLLNFLRSTFESVNNKEAERLNLLALKNHWIVRNMMSTLQEIAFSFSFSAKRQHQFQETLKETAESQEQMARRARLWTGCDTRWGARADLLLCIFTSMMCHSVPKTSMTILQHQETEGWNFFFSYSDWL